MKEEGSVFAWQVSAGQLPRLCVWQSGHTNHRVTLSPATTEPHDTQQEITPEKMTQE